MSRLLGHETVVSQPAGRTYDLTSTFEALYRAHADAVFRFAVRAVGRRDIAEEITSDAFIALFRNIDRIDDSELPAWLFTVVKNRAIDHWRHQSQEQRYLARHPGSQCSAPVEPIESWLFRHSALKPVHRICLVLRYVYDLSRAEIAQRTGLSEIQIKGHLRYARQILRRELTPSRQATRT